MKTQTQRILALAALFAAGHAQAGWIGATSGTTVDDAHNYTNVVNWAGGVIDDDFSGVTLTGATTLNFTGDHATGANGLNTSYSGNYDLILRGYNGDRTLTLNGDFTHRPTLAKTVTLGANDVGRALNLDLGGVMRTFHCGSGVTAAYITMGGISSLSNGGVVKDGKGNLTGGKVVNPYAGSTFVLEGSFAAGSGSISNSPFIHVQSLTNSAEIARFELANGLNDWLGDSTPIVLSSEASGQNRAYFHQGIWSTVDATEVIGPVILRSGMVSVTHGYKYLNVEKLFSGYIRTDSEALIRSNRTVCVFVTAHPNKETDKFNNPSLGVWRTTDGVTNCGNRFVFETPLPTIGGTNSRDTDSSVVPFLLGRDTSLGGGGNFADTFLTYDANGLRALRTVTNIVGQVPEFISSISAANADGYDNVYLRANETVAADAAVNAMVLFKSTAKVNAGVRLTVRSGLITAVGANLGQDGANGVVDVGASEGVMIRTGTGGSDGWNIWLPLAGSNGYTFAAYAAGIPVYGANTYSGQTTIACGTIYFHNKTLANVSLPDDGLVLIHPGAVLQVGHSGSWVTQEIIGGLAGSGTVRLGYISNATANNRHSLILGKDGIGTPGEITLDGGIIAPGLENEVGTLSITTEANAAVKGIPVTLTNGTLKIDITGPGVCDVLSTMTNVNINAGGSLAVNVNVDGFKPVRGQEWTIITSASGPITDGNGGKLFDVIIDNSDRVNFTASIAPDGKSVVLTAVSANSGTVLSIR